MDLLYARLCDTPTLEWCVSTLISSVHIMVLSCIIFLPSIDYCHLVLLVSLGRIAIAGNLCLIPNHHFHRVQCICSGTCHGDFETGSNLISFYGVYHADHSPVVTLSTSFLVCRISHIHHRSLVLQHLRILPTINLLFLCNPMFHFSGDMRFISFHSHLRWSLALRGPLHAIYDIRPGCHSCCC